MPVELHLKQILSYEESPQTLRGQADVRCNFLICNQKIPTDTDLEKERELDDGSHVSYVLV